MDTDSPDADAPSHGVIAYIADMLGELADMAAAKGDRGLEVTIRVAAIQALGSAAKESPHQTERSEEPRRERRAGP